MTIREMSQLLDAEILCGDCPDTQVKSACGSDMMSDVLAFVKNRAVLLTGLVNAQVIHTAEMMDMVCVVFVRSKKPGDDMIRLAQESGIAVLTSPKRMYEACGILYSHGLKGDGEIDE
jgi:hypothetical protein